jgi:hypothetical protein
MGRLLVFVLLLLLIPLAACEEKKAGESKSRNPVEQYGDDVTRAYTGTKRFAGQIDAKGLQDAIRSFQVMNSRYPKDLAELEHFIGSPLDSGKYDYDPSTGTVKEKE